MSLQHTLIARNTHIRGEIEFDGALHLQGHLTGKLSAKGQSELEIGPGGVVEGEIHAARIIVRGRVDGDIHCSEQIELAATAVVSGQVFYRALEMVKGAQVSGGLIHVEASADAEAVDAP